MDFAGPFLVLGSGYGKNRVSIGLPEDGLVQHQLLVSGYELVRFPNSLGCSQEGRGTWLGINGLVKIGLPEDGLMRHKQDIALPLQLHHHRLKPEQWFDKILQLLYRLKVMILFSWLKNKSWYKIHLLMGYSLKRGVYYFLLLLNKHLLQQSPSV